MRKSKIRFMVENKHASTNNTISYNAMISSQNLNTFFGEKQSASKLKEEKDEQE